MTRPLTPRVRDKLNEIDGSQAYADYDKDLLRLQVAALRGDYPMSDIRITQFLMEFAGGVQNALESGEKEGGDVAASIRSYVAGLVILAAATSRESRGRPPV